MTKPTEPVLVFSTRRKRNKNKDAKKWIDVMPAVDEISKIQMKINAFKNNKL